MSTNETQEDWSEPSPPNAYCPYDHVFIDTPLGRVQIEWKSWKKYPGYCAQIGDEFLGSYDNLDSAKNGGFAYISTKVKELNVWMISRGLDVS